MADQQRSTASLLRKAAIAGACGLMLAFSGVAGHAADDEDEDTFEQKIIKGILSGLGADVGRPGIDYRERSPLVVPPSLDLPPPETAAATRNPAWPKDPEKRKTATRAPKQNVRATSEDPGTAAPMTPAEMRAGTKTGGRITDPSQSGSVDDPNIGRPLRPNELGSTSLLSWGNLFGYKPETTPFTGEPSRSSLTQPPPGYQTPSQQAPYGIGQETPAGWKIPTILDRPVGNNDQ